MQTFQELYDKADAVLTKLEAAGVVVNASSRFKRYLRELAAAIPQADFNVPAILVARWHRLMIEINDLADIVDSLSMPPATEDWETAIGLCLSGGFLRTDETQHSRARDIQFELVLAAILRRCGYAPQLCEPDILTRIRDTEIAFAVKRPRSRSKLEKVVKNGARQILHARPAGLGIVAVDTTVVVNPRDRHVTTDDPLTAQDLVEKQGRVVARHIANTLQARFGADRVFAVSTRLVIPVWVPRDGRLSSAEQWNIVSLVGRNDPRSAISSELLDRMQPLRSAA